MRWSGCRDHSRLSPSPLWVASLLPPHWRCVHGGYPLFSRRPSLSPRSVAVVASYRLVWFDIGMVACFVPRNVRWFGFFVDWTASRVTSYAVLVIEHHYQQAVPDVLGQFHPSRPFFVVHHSNHPSRVILRSFRSHSPSWFASLPLNPNLGCGCGSSDYPRRTMPPTHCLTSPRPLWPPTSSSSFIQQLDRCFPSAASSLPLFPAFPQLHLHLVLFHPMMTALVWWYSTCIRYIR